MKFSANLGFLWTDLRLTDAVRAAKAAGFDAVECHWPYDIPADEIKAVLEETGLPMLGLNTRRGDVEAGDNGLSALPTRVSEARAAIDEALSYATAIDARCVHVMAGKADCFQARYTFIDNLLYACKAAQPSGINILIEPLNSYDAPGYFLNSIKQAIELIDDVGADNLKLMFDCYHVGRTEGAVLETFKQAAAVTGHVQFAAVPDRGTPDHGDVDYQTLLKDLKAVGWKGPFGAEYKPDGDPDLSLGWMEFFQQK